MKFLKHTAVLMCMALMCTVLLTACFGDRNPPGSSSSSSSSQSDSMSPSDSSMPDSPSDSSSMPSTSMEEPTAPTMSADFAKIGAIDATRKDWGPGGPKDDKNRSLSALDYNQKYGQHNAVFIKEDSPKIYLTFDQGYENGYTPKFLDTLKEKNVTGLFFLTGDYVKRQPELVQRMIDDGHVLGNHSDKHPVMTDLPLEKAVQDTKTLHDVLLTDFNYTMYLYRFPSGTFSEQTLALIKDTGYRSVFWSFAYRDWEVDKQPDPTTALKSILDSAHPGGIYMLHTVSATNADIIGDVIDGFIAKGYQLGHPSELYQ